MILWKISKDLWFLLKNLGSRSSKTIVHFNMNVDTAKSTFEILSKKGEETKISSAIKATTIQVSIPAMATDSPIKPKKGQNVMLAGVDGLLASIMMVFFMEYWEKNKLILEKPV